MERSRRLVVGGAQLRLELGLLGLGRHQARAHRRRFRALADGVDQARDRAVQFGQALLERRAARAIGGRRGFVLGVIGADVGGDGRRRQHLGPQAFQDAILDLGAFDAAAVVARPDALADIDGTDQAPRPLDRVVAAAFGALEQAGEEARLMAVGQLGRAAGPGNCEARLDGVPVGLVDDAQARDVNALPFALGPDALDALARGGVLLEVEAVPDLDADIEFAAQDPVCPLAGADHRRRAPGPAAGGRDLVVVEHAGDLDGGQALGIALEDPAHDGGLVLDDRHLPARRRAIAVDPRAGG
nr:hypothetical protein [Caulobacter sp. BP25]